MAGQGPAPKLQRQRTKAPNRGDWVQLEPLGDTILPELDTFNPPVVDAEDRYWPYISRMYWDAWRLSPVTAKWTPDDIALAVDTIYGHAITLLGGRGLPPSEVRIRQESLGLTPKGRVDRRYILPDEAPSAELHALPTAVATVRDLPDSI